MNLLGVVLTIRGNLEQPAVSDGACVAAGRFKHTGPVPGYLVIQRIIAGGRFRQTAEIRVDDMNLIEALQGVLV